MPGSRREVILVPALTTILLPFECAAMSIAQLAAVSHLAGYSGHTHALYAYQLGQ